MTIKHTPGPWHVNAIDSKRGRVTGDETSTGWGRLQVNSGNRTIATVYRANDARLIAAAPDMLEALRECVIALEMLGEEGETLDLGRLTLAKAEGGRG